MSTAMDIDDTTKQCFTRIQTRKMPSIPSACCLCPSMDLVVFLLDNSLWIHRTVSWQRLATWKEDDVSITNVAWSPDGKCLALSLSDGRLLIHHVEALSGPDGTELHTMQQENAVLCMEWAHVGRSHPSWTLSEQEVEQQVTWMYQSQYLDRSSVFLPPSAYDSQEYAEHHHASVKDMNPSCQTPLSLLCVATSQKIHLYLHGRFEIATLPVLETPTKLVCSSDLTNILIQSSCNSMTLYSLPALSSHRYTWQTTSALFGSMTTHLQSIDNSVKEVAAAWKSSLRPLDMKLDNLTRLLGNYGVSREVQGVLLDYILQGSSMKEDATSALEQFFSNVQMNDQLIQRLQRSLESAVANVESLVRKGLLAPSRALALQLGDLQFGDLDNTKLQDSTQDLVRSVEALLQKIIQARFRLRDLVAWLRSAGSQVKARGTAPDSAQSENAKKRRVSQALVERMASYLQQEQQQGCSNKSESVTERILGLSVAEFFSHDQEYISNKNRSASPKSTVEGPSSGSNIRTVTFAAHETREIMNALSAQPRDFVSKSITRKDIVLLPTDKGQSSTCAIHSRIGRDHIANEDNVGDEVETEGMFCPRLVSGDEFLGRCRNWSLVARASSFESMNDSVHLFLIPLGATGNVQDQQQTNNIPFYLNARIVLPSNHQVIDIQFYHDDGKSSLSAGTDSGTGKEGRQAIGLLVSCPMGEMISEQVWLFPYDSIPFHPVVLSTSNKGPLELNVENIVDECITHVRPMQENESTEEESPVLSAKTRPISFQQTSSSPQLLLSGSRGVGGVLKTSLGQAELDLFDLEEDEEASDDEE